MRLYGCGCLYRETPVPDGTHVPCSLAHDRYMTRPPESIPLLFTNELLDEDLPLRDLAYVEAKRAIQLVFPERAEALLQALEVDHVLQVLTRTTTDHQELARLRDELHTARWRVQVLTRERDRLILAVPQRRRV